MTRSYENSKLVRTLQSIMIRIIKISNGRHFGQVQCKVPILRE